MSNEYTVGQYLVDRLYEVGLEHLFSIPGDYTLDWLDRYVVPSKIQVVSEVSELNAGYAADGYARQKGRNGIGALCVTYAAGALSATNTIAGAYVERVPIVLISGAPSIEQTLAFEQTGFSAHHSISGRKTQLEVFEPITEAVERIDSPSLAPLLIDSVLTKCITERRPVYIELPKDIVDKKCNPPVGRLEPAQAPPDEKSLSESITRIKAQLEGAKNPLIWLGVEVDRFGLQEQAEKLIKALNIPYVTQLMSKAVLSENDPYFVGVFDGQASSSAVQDLVKTSDFILALGIWLTDINTLGWPPDLDKTAFVSLNTVRFATYFAAPVSLEHFIAGLLDGGISPREQALPKMPERKAFEGDLKDKITYQGFYDFISASITDKTIVGSDPSMNYFGTLLLKVGAARGYFAQPSYSSIGYIAPAATGICLAKKDDQRVMVFTGDGGFQMTPWCLSTQTRYGLNPIIFIIDNGVFAVEQWLANGAVFDGSGSFAEGLDVFRCSYEKLAEVIGCQGWVATTYHDLEVAIDGALKNRKSPSIIRVVVPSESIPDNAQWKVQTDKLRSP